MMNCMNTIIHFEKWLRQQIVFFNVRFLYMTNQKTMKVFIHFLMVFAGTFLFATSHAQNTLIERFGEEAIASIQGTEKLAILEFQNENGFAAQDLSGIKDVSQYPNALEVAPVAETTPALTEAIIDDGFELFAYDFPISGNTNLYYRVGDTGKLLVIYDIKAVKRLYFKESK